MSADRWHIDCFGNGGRQGQRRMNYQAILNSCAAIDAAMTATLTAPGADDGQ